ncbi:DUF2514 family protein [Enterobacter mori]|uniref:DUF2514 family protein n=1 Tax=Enterobacter mori TaxID=539813 RepID=UPI003211A682
MTAFLKVLWKPLTVSGLLLLALWGFSHIRYQAGYQAADLAWQLKDRKRQKENAEALAARQAYERAEEERRQDEATNAAKEADEQLAAARADAAVAKSAGDGLRTTIADLKRQLATSKTGELSAIAAASAARANTAILLANVLERADKRAGELAEYADRARIKGLQCENTYKGVTNTH